MGSNSGKMPLEQYVPGRSGGAVNQSQENCLYNNHRYTCERWGGDLSAAGCIRKPPRCVIYTAGGFFLLLFSGRQLPTKTGGMFMKHLHFFMICVLILLLCLLPGISLAVPAEAALAGGTAEKPPPVAGSGNPPPPEPGGQPDFTGAHPLVVQLNYLKVDQARSLLSALVPEEKIKTDPLRNTLVIMGSPEEYDQVNYLLARIDTPPKQVMFEVQVIELNRDDMSNLGVD
jgi:hypothetical protein